MATGAALASGTLTNGGTTALTMEELIAFGGMALRLSPLGLIFLMEGDTPHHGTGSISIPDVGTKSKEEEYITLYRGVSQSAGVYYAAAMKGIAVPKGLSFMYSHSNPDDHTSGDNYSIWTSWSSDKSVANYFASGTMGVEKGVILEKKFLKSILIRSNLSAIMQESEWLVPGVVTGAKVSPNKK